MRIVSKLRLTTALSIAVAAAIGLVLLESERRVGRELVRVREVDDMVHAVFELELLTDDFLTGVRGRVEQQWRAHHRTLESFVDSCAAFDGDEAGLIVRMREESTRVRELFDRLARVGVQAPAIDAAGTAALERQLAAQIEVGLRAIAADGERLQAAMVARIKRWERLANRRAFAFGGGMALFVTLLAALTMRNTVRPIAQLKEGMRRVGQGRLDGRTAIDTNDEIGEMSRQFDAMVARLQASMASREELEREIARRERVETELSRSNRELEQFAYVASHDLQEPLRKIIAFGDLLSAECEKALPESGRQYVAYMRDAALRMQSLIDDLLAFSRVTTRAKPFTSVDLNRTMKGVLSDLEYAIHKTGARVEVGTLPVVEAEGVQMRQLLLNLVGNGVKFHRDGVPPAIKVYAGNSRDEADGMQTIFVEDNGIGFEQRFAERIFGVFQRLHRRDQYAGTGIGLALCRRIVERHGGRIGVESEPGRGTRFRVSLPRRPPDPQQGESHDVVSNH